MPKYNLAIEFDGLFWHSLKEPNYHLNKTKLCENKNIQLLHIFENEWIYRRDIWKSIIRSKLNLTYSIYARNCSIREINYIESNEFLDSNHLQGKIGFNVGIGLFYGNNLVSMICFGIPRYNKLYKFELLRYCTKLDTRIVGGFSKLLKFFTEKYSKSIITYADRRYSNGSVYEKNGFNFICDTNPNYFYFNKSMKLESRIKYQKHKLKNLLQSYNDNLSEYENMKNNGYSRIYDCGNKVYEYKNEDN